MRLTNDEGLNLKDLSVFSAYKQRTFAGHKRLPTSLAWNQDGRYLVTAQNYIRLWSFDENIGLEKTQKAKGHDSLIDEVKFYDNNVFVSMSRDTLKFWDIRQNMSKCIKSDKKIKEDFVNIVWQNDMKYTLLMKDSSISMFDMREGSGSNLILKTVESQSDIFDIIWDNTYSVLFCGGFESGSGIITMLTDQLQPIPQIFACHTAKINSLAIDCKNQYLATGSDDSIVQIHTLPQVLCTRNYSYSDSPYKKVAFSYDGQYLAASSDEQFIDFFNVKQGGRSFKLKCSLIQEHLQWHPKKLILALIDQDDKKKGGLDKNEQNIKIFSI